MKKLETKKVSKKEMNQIKGAGVTIGGINNAGKRGNAGHQ